MKAFHIFISVGLVGVLIWLNRMFGTDTAIMYGGLTWIG